MRLALAVTRRASLIDPRETPDWCISDRHGSRLASPRACYSTAEVVHPRLAVAAVFVAGSLSSTRWVGRMRLQGRLPHSRFSHALRGSFCESPSVLFGCLGRTAKVGKDEFFAVYVASHLSWPGRPVACDSKDGSVLDFVPGGSSLGLSSGSSMVFSRSSRTV